MQAPNQTRSLEFPVNAYLMGDGKRINHEGITLCKQLLNHQGYCLLRQLPDNFGVGQFLGNFGSLISQYGVYVYSVKSIPELENYSFSKSANALKPHTDGSDYDLPPRWLALLCLEPSSCCGGKTLIADGYKFIESLDINLRRESRAKIYRFESSKGIHFGRSESVASPLVSEGVVIKRPIFRFSYNLLMHGDYSASIHNSAIEADSVTQELCHQLLSFFERHHYPILLGRKDLLIWDNWRMFHSRTQYRDPKRHLLRYWISQSQ